MKNLSVLLVFVAFFSLYFLESSADPHEEIIGFWRSANTLHPSTGKYSVLTITEKKYFMQKNLNNAPDVGYTKIDGMWQAKKRSWVAMLDGRILKSNFKLLSKNTLEFSQSVGAREENFGKFIRITKKEATRLLVPKVIRTYRY